MLIRYRPLMAALLFLSNASAREVTLEESARPVAAGGIAAKRTLGFALLTSLAVHLGLALGFGYLSPSLPAPALNTSLRITLLAGARSKVAPAREASTQTKTPVEASPSVPHPPAPEPASASAAKTVDSQPAQAENPMLFKPATQSSPKHQRAERKAASASKSLPRTPPRASSHSAAAAEKVETATAAEPYAPAPDRAASGRESFSEARYHGEGLSNRKPVYPYAARRRGLEGRVVLGVTVTSDGSAAAVEVVSSSGSALLDQAALQAVQGWRFIPAQRNGQAVSGRVQVPITFRLE
jgi:protein TonB